MIRVAIVDDQPLFSDGLGRIVGAQPEMEVVGTAHDGKSGVAMCQELRPDVVFNALATLLGVTYNEARSRADLRASLESLSERTMERFNRENPDDPRVRRLYSREMQHIHRDQRQRNASRDQGPQPNQGP